MAVEIDNLLSVRYYFAEDIAAEVDRIKTKKRQDAYRAE